MVAARARPPHRQDHQGVSGTPRPGISSSTSTKKEIQDVTSTDVNDYLREITGKEITAKDFRTWAGTVLAAMALNELESFDSAAQAKRNLRAAIEKVAARLGNTPAICRKCYVHPEVLNSYLDGNLVLELKSNAESELRNMETSEAGRGGGFSIAARAACERGGDFAKTAGPCRLIRARDSLSFRRSLRSTEHLSVRA